jgi:recombination protein RecT
MTAATTTAPVTKRAPTLADFLNSPGARARLDEVATRFMRPEELIRLALMAASRNPDLLKCATHSILRSLMDAAACGIAPSGQMGRGYLVPRKNNKTGELEASFDPGWRGLADIAKRSGAVKRIDAKVVYEGDEFEYTEGTEQRLVHRPNLDLPDDDEEAAEQDQRRIICAYAIATFEGGEKQIEVLRKSDIERIRKVSAAQGGPWGSWYDEMARKSAVRRLCKYMPYDPMLERALDMVTDIETGQRTTVDMAPKRVPASVEDLESRLLAEKPVTVPVDAMPMSRGEAVATARTEKQKAEPKPAKKEKPAETAPAAAADTPPPGPGAFPPCIVCGQQLGANDAIKAGPRTPGGPPRWRHSACAEPDARAPDPNEPPFGALSGDREPGDDA